MVEPCDRTDTLGGRPNYLPFSDVPRYAAPATRAMYLDLQQTDRIHYKEKRGRDASGVLSHGYDG